MHCLANGRACPAISRLVAGNLCGRAGPEARRRGQTSPDETGIAGEFQFGGQIDELLHRSSAAQHICIAESRVYRRLFDSIAFRPQILRIRDWYYAFLHGCTAT
jgi:hypothetical protein